MTIFKISTRKPEIRRNNKTKTINVFVVYTLFVAVICSKQSPFTKKKKKYMCEIQYRRRLIVIAIQKTRICIR